MIQTINDYNAIAAVVRLYMKGAPEGNVSKLRQAFHPDARVFGTAGGKRVDLAMGPFFELSAAHPLNSTAAYQARMLSVQQCRVSTTFGGS